MYDLTEKGTHLCLLKRKLPFIYPTTVHSGMPVSSLTWLVTLNPLDGMDSSFGITSQNGMKGVKRFHVLTPG
jgi:hypothetical protein